MCSFNCFLKVFICPHCLSLSGRKFHCFTVLHRYPFPTVFSLSLFVDSVMSCSISILSFTWEGLSKLTIFHIKTRDWCSMNSSAMSHPHWFIRVIDFVLLFSLVTYLAAEFIIVCSSFTFLSVDPPRQEVDSGVCSLEGYLLTFVWISCLCISEYVSMLLWVSWRLETLLFLLYLGEIPNLDPLGYWSLVVFPSGWIWFPWDSLCHPLL